MKKLAWSIQKRPVNPILILAVAGAYVINNCYLKAHTGGALQYFLICHFNDLICPLLFFAYANLLLLTVEREITRLWVILLISMGTSFLWEFAAPLFKASATTDPVDLACYIAGGILYWVILRCTAKKNQ